VARPVRRSPGPISPPVGSTCVGAQTAIAFSPGRRPPRLTRLSLESTGYLFIYWPIQVPFLGLLPCYPHTLSFFPLPLPADVRGLASTLRMVATPPRVASRTRAHRAPRRACRPPVPPRAFSVLHVRLDFQLAPGQHDGHAVVADRPRTRGLVPGRGVGHSHCPRPSATGATPAVIDVFIRLPSPLSTTIGVTGDHGDPSRCGRVAHGSAIWVGRLRESPRSLMKRPTGTAGSAGHREVVDRALTALSRVAAGKNSRGHPRSVRGPQAPLAPPPSPGGVLHGSSSGLRNASRNTALAQFVGTRLAAGPRGHRDSASPASSPSLPGRSMRSSNLLLTFGRGQHPPRSSWPAHLMETPRAPAAGHPAIVVVAAQAPSGDTRHVPSGVSGVHAVPNTLHSMV